MVELNSIHVSIIRHILFGCLLSGDVYYYNMIICVNYK